ncbi:chaperone protein dnaJ 39 isoform X2 [Eutrema salsugineum]|uniref:chaperone protein dnaJ 39 isoform X2 n=1 Tax=Eutrema salsugineum TaxID=72664 RepID=UPI000CECFBBA|nr:chaperone protein dnaJ 39 isoform X2 [Eutrema salsugineum]
MPTQKSRSEKKDAGEDELRRNPYQVLGIPSNSTDQEIKSAYRRMALRYHPDKNPNDPVAADMFKEVTFAYDVLSDPENRRQYDTTGSEAAGPENEDLELDLSSLGAVNTIFAALFNKLGVQIKTTVSANLLEEALNEEEAQAGLICKVQSSAKNKFKLLYFDQEENGGLSLALQEGSKKTGKLSTAGLYFFGFPVYRFDHRVNSRALSRDPETGFFKRLDAFQPFEITELKAGSHVFAVYGDNFFKSVNYTLEIFSSAPFANEKESLRSTEAQIVSKRTELLKFESEYHEVFAQFTEMASKCTGEVQEIDELLKRRNEICAAYTIFPPTKQGSSKNRSWSRKKSSLLMEPREEGEVTVREEDVVKKKKWYNIQLRQDKKKT